MAQNVNPFTGREVAPSNIIATPNGHIVFDEKDGALWGDFALDPNTDADKLFQSVFGFERPTDYKQYLAKLRETDAGSNPDENANPDANVEAGSAADVLDDDTDAQVVVTRQKHYDYAKIFGIPGASQDVHAGGDGSTPRNLTNLNPGANGKRETEEPFDPALAAQRDTPETAAARAKADAQFDGGDQGVAETTPVEQGEGTQVEPGTSPEGATTLPEGGTDVSQDGGESQVTTNGTQE